MFKRNVIFKEILLETDINHIIGQNTPLSKLNI